MSFVRRLPTAENGGSGSFPQDDFGKLLTMILDFLDSKSFVATQRSLRNEIEQLLHCSQTDGARIDRDTWSQLVAARSARLSELEVLLGQASSQSPHEDEMATPRQHVAFKEEPVEEEEPQARATAEDLTPLASPWVAEPSFAASRAQRSEAKMTKSRSPKLWDMVAVSASEAARLRDRKGEGNPMHRVIFHDSLSASQVTKEKLAHVALPMLYNPNFNGLEDRRDLALPVGEVIANRYRVEAVLGKGSFSTVVKCHDLTNDKLVGIKVLLNNKECFDAGLGEVRVLAHLMKKDPQGEQPIVRLLDYFYYREHLLIATELCGDSLFAFSRMLDSEGHRMDYFTSETVATITYQVCKGLAHLHGMGIVHSDVKTENVCMVSASRRLVKLIDFGSVVYKYDCHNSYVQSRWYRAPEVMLGNEWDDKIDLWSVGAMVAELVLGAPLFNAPTVPEVLAGIVAVIGPFPEHMKAACTELSSMFFDRDGTIYEVDPASHRGVVVKLQAKTQVALDQLLSPINSSSLVEFTSALLTIDPSKRLSAVSALRHPFLKGVHTPKLTKSPNMLKTFTAGLFSRSAQSSPATAWGSPSRLRRLAGSFSNFTSVAPPSASFKRRSGASAASSSVLTNAGLLIGVGPTPAEKDAIASTKNTADRA